MADLELFEEIVRLKRAGTPAVLALVVESSGSAPRKAGARMLLREDGSILGSVGGGRVEQEALAVGRQVLADGQPRTLALELTPEHGMVCGGRVLLYLEPLSGATQLVIIGAGHVGQALARAARPAGFAVTLVDPSNRDASARVAGFAAPDLRCEVDEVFAQLPVDERSAVVIAAPSHEDDFRAALAALATPAGFIGLLGSRRKKQALLDFLKDSGCREEDAARIVTPVGLEIGSETPEEIAISILAQLIAVRRQHAAPGLRSRSGRRPVAADGTSQTPAPLR